MAVLPSILCKSWGLAISYPADKVPWITLRYSVRRVTWMTLGIVFTQDGDVGEQVQFVFAAPSPRRIG